nr:glucans biosynthesis glucosyltransferase MdoH [Paracoccus sp. (in: a-proteobacteria)]
MSAPLTPVAAGHAPGGPAADAPAGLPPVPPQAPLQMPEQDFRAPPPPGPAFQRAAPDVLLARLIAFGGAALVTGIGFWQMLLVFGDRIQPLQYALLALFTLTFGWVGFSFCSMLAGLVARPPETPVDPGNARVAVVMPVYHEDAAVSMGLLAALADELAAEGMVGRAEIFVLSDSRDPDWFAAETLAVSALREICPLPVWYRRRTDNTGRKAGNIADFVRRWGGRYDQMVVLDADSVVSGRVIGEMSARMSADPALALIQTVPMLVGGQTIFARVTQFAGRFYGPVIARGVATWSGDNGNFWGHNAMIRVRAFAECCGLP